MAGVNSEMDALPGIGHGCGHNLIAISGVGVALAVKAALQTHKIPGKVVLLGTPGIKSPVNNAEDVTDVGCTGEEGGGGKTILLNRGGYKGMDFCLMSDFSLPKFSLPTDGRNWCVGRTQLRCRLERQPLEPPWLNRTSPSNTLATRAITST